MKKLQKWTRPAIEEIELKFDKEMDAPCFGSANTPQHDGICKYDPCSSHNCWNKNDPNDPCTQTPPATEPRPQSSDPRPLD